MLVERNGIVTGTGLNGTERQRLNFTEGSGMAVTVADGTDASEAVVSWATRDGIRLAGEGLKGETISRQSPLGATITVDGTAYFSGLGLMAGDVVTKLYVMVSTLGNTMTLSKVGLYSKAGTLLASSADQGSSWSSATGLKEISLVSPFTVVTTDLYYCALVSKASVTLPTLLRGAASSAQGAIAVPGAVQAYGTQTGQTDLPSPATIGTTAPISYWFGWA